MIHSIENDDLVQSDFELRELQYKIAVCLPEHYFLELLKVFLARVITSQPFVALGKNKLTVGVR